MFFIKNELYTSAKHIGSDKHIPSETAKNLKTRRECEKNGKMQTEVVEIIFYIFFLSLNKITKSGQAIYHNGYRIIDHLPSSVINRRMHAHSDGLRCHSSSSPPISLPFYVS